MPALICPQFDFTNRITVSHGIGAGHLYRSSRVRTCSSLASIGLVCFVISHSIWQAFGDAILGPAVAPGRLQHFDDGPSYPAIRTYSPSGPAVGVAEPEWSMRHARVARSRRRRMISAVKPVEYMGPGFIVDIASLLPRRVGNPGAVDEHVYRDNLELRCGVPDAFGIGYIHCNDIEHVLRQASELCGVRVVARDKYAPSLSQLANSKPSPRMGPVMSCCCHRMLSGLRSDREILKEPNA